MKRTQTTSIIMDLSSGQEDVPVIAEWELEDEDDIDSFVFHDIQSQHTLDEDDEAYLMGECIREYEAERLSHVLDRRKEAKYERAGI